MKMIPVPVRFGPKLLNQIQAVAQETEASQSEVIRQAVKIGLGKMIKAKIRKEAA